MADPNKQARLNKIAEKVRGLREQEFRLRGEKIDIESGGVPTSTRMLRHNVQSVMNLADVVQSPKVASLLESVMRSHTRAEQEGMTDDSLKILRGEIQSTKNLVEMAVGIDKEEKTTVLKELEVMHGRLDKISGGSLRRERLAGATSRFMSTMFDPVNIAGVASRGNPIVMGMTKFIADSIRERKERRRQDQIFRRDIQENVVSKLREHQEELHDKQLEVLNAQEEQIRSVSIGHGVNKQTVLLQQIEEHTRVMASGEKRDEKQDVRAEADQREQQIEGKKSESILENRGGGKATLRQMSSMFAGVIGMLNPVNLISKALPIVFGALGVGALALIIGPLVYQVATELLKKLDEWWVKQFGTEKGPIEAIREVIDQVGIAMQYMIAFFKNPLSALAGTNDEINALNELHGKKEEPRHEAHQNAIDRASALMSGDGKAWLQSFKKDFDGPPGDPEGSFWDMTPKKGSIMDNLRRQEENAARNRDLEAAAKISAMSGGGGSPPVVVPVGSGGGGSGGGTTFVPAMPWESDETYIYVTRQNMQ